MNVLQGPIANVWNSQLTNLIFEDMSWHTTSRSKEISLKGVRLL